MPVTKNSENTASVEPVPVSNNNAAATSASSTPTSDQFDALCDQYYHSWFRFHPEKAVAVGVYDYAHQLTSFEHDDIGALIALNQKMQSALDEINIAELDKNRQLDMRIINGAISI